MNIKERFIKVTYRIENNFFLTVIRHGLTMMIPLLLVGGVACALMSLPLMGENTIPYHHLLWLYSILNAIYQGTFGLFSLSLVIALSSSYGMERNETHDKIASYVIVALGAYGVQLNIGTENFDLSSLGAGGSFSAMFITLCACYLFEKLRNLTALSLKKYTIGMESLCANAIQTLLPIAVIMVSSILFTRMLHVLFGVYSLHELFSSLSCSLFAYVKNNFASGLLFTFLLHQLWICGFHGSHLLEPVASTEFACVSPQTIFSKSFFDTYVVMGGCGTTICVLLLLLIFYRKDRMGNLAKVGAVSVIFNINEVLNFGLPIVLNPVMAIPFLVTPIVTYCTAYAATWLGLVPAVTHEIQWSPPPLLSGYLATGSVRGTIRCTALSIPR